MNRNNNSNKIEPEIQKQQIWTFVVKMQKNPIMYHNLE